MNNKKRRKKKKILTKVLIIIAIVIVIAAVAIRILQNRVTSQFASSSADEVVSAEVTTGTISTTVSGSGTLAEEGAEELKVPAAITIDEIVVNDGDTVAEGDVIATADDASVVRAMSDLQTAIDELDTQLTDASAETASTTVTTSVAGRVKKIYAAAGDDVASVMYDDGALALLSLDGYMSVEIETSDLTEGESVTVTTEAGVSYSGKVDTVQSKKATVLVSDNGPSEGESVDVKNAAGTTVGSGELHVHEALKITGYAGTVSAVSVSENASVSAGATLFTLTDTSYTADYNELLEQRETMEERLEELIVIYKDGAVKAPMAGTVRELTDTDSTSTTTTTSSTDTLTAQTTLVTICPDTTMSVEISVDESDILSLSTGQEVSLTIDSIDSDTTFTGTVEEIGTSGTSSSGVTTYPVTVTLDKTDEMRAGMSVSAAIQIESVENALMVPEEAVTQTRSKTYVYTSVDETTGELSGMQEVTTGISGNGYIEITDGLSEGDTVYYTESTTTFDFSMPGGMSDFGGGDMDIDIGGDSSSGGGGGGQMPDNSGGGGGSMPDGGGSMPGGGSSN